MRILVTGVAGMVCTYLTHELLEAGHEVWGLDNQSRYGQQPHAAQGRTGFRLIAGDSKDVDLLRELLHDCDHVVAAAAVLGGLAFVDAHALDILLENERITAAVFEAAAHARGRGRLQKITAISSSMAMEQAATVPVEEGTQWRVPPPTTSYGFQKLGIEVFARAALRQYGLPYTIARPSNCLGIGELGGRSRHVVFDLTRKIRSGQDPLRLLGDGQQRRNFIYGGDLARGIRLCVESPAALNQDFNLSSARSTSIRELAEAIWRRVHRDGRPFRYVGEPALTGDLPQPDLSVEKARRLLGFEASTTLDAALDQIVPWIEARLAEEP